MSNGKPAHLIHEFGLRNFSIPMLSISPAKAQHVFFTFISISLKFLGFELESQKINKSVFLNWGNGKMKQDHYENLELVRNYYIRWLHYCRHFWYKFLLISIDFLFSFFGKLIALKNVRSQRRHGWRIVLISEFV